jgi:hypothetical protein
LGGPPPVFHGAAAILLVNGDEMMGIDLTFKCPECGGSSFGSWTDDDSQNPDAKWTRCCHGDDAQDGRHGCRFTFPEKDDWKYFLCNGKKIETSAEYDIIMEKIRSTPAYGIGPFPSPRYTEF